MLPRYTRPEMGHVWSDANRFAGWLEVEIAAAETLAETGQVPPRRGPPDDVVAGAEDLFIARCPGETEYLPAAAVEVSS